MDNTPEQAWPKWRISSDPKYSMLCRNCGTLNGADRDECLRCGSKDLSSDPVEVGLAIDALAKDSIKLPGIGNCAGGS